MTKTIQRNIQLLREVESVHGIQPLNVGFDKDGVVNMDDTLFDAIKKAFASTKCKPVNYKDLKKLKVGKIRSITCNDVMMSKRIRSTRQGKRGEYSCIEYGTN